MFNAHEFAARLSSHEDRWSLLKDFIAEWHGPLEDGDGCSAAEMDAAEQRLGLKLPLALREWYTLAGQREDIVAVQNFLRSPDRLFTRGQDGAAVLYFYTENQACVNWGILVSNLALDDPPVYLDETKGVENRTLSEFITQMVVLETACFGGKCGGNGPANPEALEAVRRHFVPLGLPEWHWPINASRLYGGNDVLIEAEASEDGYQWIWIGARSQSALKDAAQRFSIDWECLDLD